MDHNVRSLIAAILVQAKRDISNKTSSGYSRIAAYRFIHTEYCKYMCEAINIDYDNYKRKSIENYNIVLEEQIHE